MAGASSLGLEMKTDEVIDASEPTLAPYSRRSNPQMGGGSGIHELTNPVATLRQLGAARRAVIVVNELSVPLPQGFH